MAEKVKGIELWARLRAKWRGKASQKGGQRKRESRSGEDLAKEGYVQGRGQRAEGEAVEHRPLEMGRWKGPRTMLRG